MIKASSLFYAIVISVIMAILSGMCIMTFYISDIEFQSYEFRNRLNSNAQSGLNLLMSESDRSNDRESRTIDLFGKGSDSVKLHRTQWGAFQIACSQAIFKDQQVTRIAMTGFPVMGTNRYSLYLADENKPLAISGNTIIRGNALLPASGVKRAYIEGQNYIGSELVYGNVGKSSKSVPEFDKDLITHLEQILKQGKISDNDSVILIGAQFPYDTLINSFLKNTCILLSSQKIIISSKTFSGNVIVLSNKEIEIFADANLTDIIVCAPKVTIRENFKGALQVFASDSINLEKNVTLNYPSVLGLISDQNTVVASSINLTENDTIRGSVFAFQTDKSQIKQMSICFAKDSFLMGQVQTNGVVDLKGCIYGSLMCKKIMLATSSSVYENHLLNATIDITKLSEHYAGICLISNDSPQRIMKWLN